MKNYIESLVRNVVSEQIDKQLNKNSDSKLSPEEFAEEVSLIVGSKIPDFEVETYREFDDPYDSFSTEKMIKFSYVTEQWLWDKKNNRLNN